jgi:hypothetical protein
MQMPFDPVLYYAQQMDGAVPGLTLRDLFAAAALVGSLANQSCRGSINDFATDAYRFADAMLAARESKGDDHAE